MDHGAVVVPPAAALPTPTAPTMTMITHITITGIITAFINIIIQLYPLMLLLLVVKMFPSLFCSLLSIY